MHMLCALEYSLLPLCTIMSVTVVNFLHVVYYVYMHGILFSILNVHISHCPFEINLVFLVLAVVQLCKSQKVSSVRETSNTRVAL